MKSKGIRHLLVMAVCIIITASSLVGCDFTCDCNIYFDNKTSDTIVLAYLDSADFSFRFKGPLTIEPGGTILVIDDYTFDRNPTKDDVIWDMNKYFPEGLIMTSHDSRSRCFSPDSANSQSNSPFVESSFRYESEKGTFGYNLYAYYEITESIMNN